MTTSEPELLVAAGSLMGPDADPGPGWLLVSGERITQVGTGVPPKRPDLEFPAGVVAPGFVDTHVHGGGGASFSTTQAREAEAAARFHLTHGTTSMVASLVSAPLEELARQIDVLADLVDDGILAGIHLEGPWLSPRFKGAHDPGCLLRPEPQTVTRVLDAGRGAVRMVTLAPELDPDQAVVRRVTDAGAVVAIGHTAADFDTTRRAIDAGATVATHLFNGMPALHHRTPGPVLALLQDPRVAVELIFDGVHLHPEVAAWAMRCAAGGSSLVTDAISAAGKRDGRYQLGGLDVDVRDGKATLAGSDVIAGSTLTMHQALTRAVGAGVPLADVLRSCSTTPAAKLGLTDVGRLAPGLLANLVVLDPDLALGGVMQRGRWVMPPEVACS
jgi:N-acetylglucosamine-6-phosphate deacetylase